MYMMYMLFFRNKQDAKNTSDSYYDFEATPDDASNNNVPSNGHIPKHENGSIRSQPPDIIESHELTTINGDVHRVGNGKLSIVKEAKTTPNNKGNKPTPTQTVEGVPGSIRSDTGPVVITNPQPISDPPPVKSEVVPDNSPKAKRGSVFKYIETLERSMKNKEKVESKRKLPVILPVAEVPPPAQPPSPPSPTPPQPPSPPSPPPLQPPSLSSPAPPQPSPPSPPLTNNNNVEQIEPIYDESPKVVEPVEPVKPVKPVDTVPSVDPIEPIYTEVPVPVEPHNKEPQSEPEVNAPSKTETTDIYAVVNKPSEAKQSTLTDAERRASRKKRKVTFADEPAVEIEPEVPPKCADL